MTVTSREVAVRQVQWLIVAGTAAAIFSVGIGSAGISGANTHCSPTWRAVASPAVANGALHAVVAGSVRDAWAVGSTNEFGPDPDPLPLIEHWNGVKWTTVESHAPDGVLLDVASVSASDVWAVGRAGDEKGQSAPWVPLLEHWNGKTWTVVHTTTPDELNADWVTLTSVAAVRSGQVWVVADRFARDRDAVLHWNGKTWSRLGGRLSVSLADIVVLSERNVWAVGSKGDDPAALHWDGSRWRTYIRPHPTAWFRGSLDRVAAFSATDIWAAGTLQGESTFGRQNFVLHWNGARWDRAPEPQSVYQPSAIAARAQDELFVVSSDVGLLLFGGAGEIQHWTGTSWQMTKLRYGNVLYGVASAPAERVWAVGFTGTGDWMNVDDKGFPEQWAPLIERYGC